MRFWLLRSHQHSWCRVDIAANCLCSTKALTNQTYFLQPEVWCKNKCSILFFCLYSELRFGCLMYIFTWKKVELNEWMKFLQQIVESKLLFFFNWASIPCPVILKRINIIFSDPNMTYSLLSGVIMVNDVTSGFLQIHLFSNYLRVGKLNWFQTILATLTSGKISGLENTDWPGYRARRSLNISLVTLNGFIGGGVKKRGSGPRAVFGCLAN